MPKYPNLIKLIKLINVNVPMIIYGTMLGIVGGIVISMIIGYVLINMLNILTDNKLIINIITYSVGTSCVLNCGILGFITVLLYINRIINNDKNTITDQV